MKQVITLVGVLAALLLQATPTVTNVAAKQRYPWNGLVDITVTLSGTEEECAAATFPFYVTNKTTRAELPIGSVKAVGAIAGAGNTWTRRFVWNATTDVGYAKFGEVELTVGALVSGGVQLWENGPYWAECNVGAAKPEDPGYYFWWGDTTGHKRNAANNGWVSVKDGSSFSFSSCPTSRKSNEQLQAEGYIDSMGNLLPVHDAVAVYLGAQWRMPTDAEVGALIDNCDTELTTCNGMSGQLVKGRGVYASKSIFLPCTGYGLDSDLRVENGGFWSSTLYGPTASNLHAWSLRFNNGFLYKDKYSYRYYGLSVRPVRGFAK